jgi:membrane-bound lytic murein transglycosylase B
VGQRPYIFALMQKTPGYTTSLLAAMGVLLCVPSALGSTGARAPALERDAHTLLTATARVHEAIDRWRGQGDPSSARPPLDVVLAALAQQRFVIRVTAKPRRAEALLARVRGPLRPHILATVRARLALLRLSPAPPRPVSAFRTGPALPPDLLLRYYREAQRRFQVGWHVLAAVNFVESAFGRLRSPSWAGALGPMQFLASTWRAYGLGGNVHDPRDAIFGAANYLRASGAPRDYRRALYAYNHSHSYLEAVLRYAERMKRDLRAFYAYYSWQVFVRTPSGLRRLTGPGLG